jgi:hypothetical protein
LVPAVQEEYPQQVALAVQHCEFLFAVETTVPHLAVSAKEPDAQATLPMNLHELLTSLQQVVKSQVVEVEPAQYTDPGF